MNVRCWINGIPGDRIPVDDRGLQYGDGVFETMAIRKGRISLLDFHVDRLADGCERLAIPPPDTMLIRDEISETINGRASGVLKLIVTRGGGGRGYRFPKHTEPLRIMTWHTRASYPDSWRENGIRVRLCSTRLGNNPQLAGIKHLNRLEQILARAEWADTDEIQEGLMTDADDMVIEGTMTNVFACLADGTWTTPRLISCGVAGVMRRYLLERAEQQGKAIQARGISLTDIRNARELFVCNSVVGIWPVRQFDDAGFKVGGMTRQAQQWVDEL